ncbi:MAG TPA: hypothetical protein VGQ04_08890 [Chitinophagaceae bacterium]|jgi:hypothetical protein|nr:hypothetical protein [Chitinophagaceae bacterium]
MKSFKIISTAWGLAIFSMLLIVFLGIIITINILPEKSNFSIVATIIILAAGFYLQRFISRAEIEVTLFKEFIAIKYLKQYIFHKDPDRKIFFNEIKSYKYQEDRNFDLFRLTLADGTEIDFWHFTFTKDDFEGLVSTFPNYINHHNKFIETAPSTKQLKHSTKIEREKTIYERASSPFIVIMAIISIVLISILMIFKKDSVTNPFMGLSAITGALFYVTAYFKYRKKKK